MVNRILTLFFVCSVCSVAWSQGQTGAVAGASASAPAAASGSPEASPLNEAKELFKDNHYSEAAVKFRAIVAGNPKSEEAQALLVRSLLNDHDPDAAEEAAKKAMEALPSSAAVKAAAGDAAFRLGKFEDADADYRAAFKLDPKNSRGWYGVGRIYEMVSLHHKAKLVLAKAHDLDPEDQEIFGEWVSMLSAAERLEALKKHFGDKPNTRQQEALDRAAAIAKKEPWTLVSEIKPYEIKMGQIGRKESLNNQEDAVIAVASGYALQVRFNDRASADLKLDTGAGGIVIGRRLAEKAGFVKLSDTYIGGIGDKGEVRAERGWIDKITIGPIEFRNCLVEVSSRNGIMDDQGLIGPDVFAKFLITLDFREKKMLLGPLPKNPNATGNGLDDQDRYVAPEMQSYTKIWRFGHDLMIPVLVSDKATGNFILDTGAETNHFSTRIAAKVTRLDKDGMYHIQGISGDVKNVASGNKAILQFGPIRARSDDFPASSFESLSENEGTDIAGLIGIKTLVQTKMTIDYRDGLVKFDVYDFKPARE